MYRILAAVIVLFVLSGCASSRTIYTPNGSIGHSINCSGLARSWDMCYEKAGELCNAYGYDVISQDSTQGFIVSEYYTGSTYGRHLVIQCRA